MQWECRHALRPPHAFRDRRTVHRTARLSRADVRQAMDHHVSARGAARMAGCAQGGHDAFTTVANWRSYGPVHHDGMFLGQKVHALRPLIDLPRKTHSRFVLALTIHPTSPIWWRCSRPGGRWSIRDSQRARRRTTGDSSAGRAPNSASRRADMSSRDPDGSAIEAPVISPAGDRCSPRTPASPGCCQPVKVSSRSRQRTRAGIDAIETDYPRHREAARAIAEDTSIPTAS